MKYNQLAQHIELLLTEHDCVVVPELGAFILQQSGARLESGRLIAPHTVIGFNAQLTHDDGLLATAYARTAHVRYPEAKRILANNVAELRTMLKQTSVTFGRIGTFQTVADRIMFTPSACAFLPDNFGRRNLTLVPRKTTQQKPAETITLTIRRDTLRRVAACLIGICLLALAPKGIQSDYTTYANLSPINFAQIVADRNAAIEAERQAALAREEAARLEAERAKRHFHLVVAALDVSSAEKMCAKLQAQGYNEAHVLPYKKNLHRVALASYKTKKEALRVMKTTRKATRYKQAWVWCE